MVTLSHFIASSQALAAASAQTSATSLSTTRRASSSSTTIQKSAPQQKQQPTESQLTSLRESIKSLLHQPSYDDGSAGPVLVRLAWHSAGTYCAESNTGGSNGAGMRYEAEGGDPANAGLQHARAFLEPVKHQHPWVTYADLWTLASIVAIEEMGGPRIPWKGGRTDFTDDTKIPPRGRLPDGAQGADHIRWIFYRMGFNDQEIVALSGAHNLGRCHSDRSGFEGKWVNNPTRFSNTYFKLLLANEKEWKKIRLDNGVEQFVYVDPEVLNDDSISAEEKKEETLMMLPTDIALINDPSFRPWVEKYAANKDLFYDHFTQVFAKLMELGIHRDADGNVVNEENLQEGYKSAPKKSDTATATAQTATGGKMDEAKRLKEENEEFRQKRREGARL